MTSFLKLLVLVPLGLIAGLATVTDDVQRNPRPVIVDHLLIEVDVEAELSIRQIR